MFNQLSTKTLNVPKELFLVTGGISTDSADAWSPLSDSFFTKRIPESQKHYIGSVTTWQANVKYNYYVADDNYQVVYNEDNQTVYLCLHNNSDFRNDLDSGLSTEQPSHATGRQTYSDGYTWLPLFKVDFTEWEFITPNEIPIPKLDLEKDYNTFSEKYESLCGPKGVTSFGCCCLYFKENSVDEITREVYTKGDVTNETIFSDCYECQKLAEALDREVLFLSGYTAGSIKTSQTGENPLCPATKTINSLKEALEADKYNIVPGSSKEYQLFLLNNHNDLGIMVVNIDLSNLTDAQKTIRYDNPVLKISDTTGTGATIKIKTTPIGLNSHFVYGIELLTEGSGYGDLAVPDNTGSIIGTALFNRITVYNYYSDVYTNPQRYVKPQKLKVSVTVTDDEIRTVLPGLVKHTKFAVMADPYFLDSNAPAVYTKNDTSVQNMTTKVTIYKPSTIITEN